jgi:hypothetical protein
MPNTKAGKLKSDWSKLSALSLQPRAETTLKRYKPGKGWMTAAVRARVDYEYERDKKWLQESPGCQSIHR